MSYDFVDEDGVYKLFATSCRSVAIAICESAQEAERLVGALNFREDVEDLFDSKEITLEDVEAIASLNLGNLFKIG